MQMFRVLIVALVLSGMISGPAKAVEAASVNGTTIPMASQIVDADGAIWTVKNGIIYRNNVASPNTRNVVQLVYFNNHVYQEAENSWWYWNGADWIVANSVHEASLNASTSPSYIQLVDSEGNIWAVNDGVIYENGQLAGFSAGVITLLYDHGAIYQENIHDDWWIWNGSTWIALTDPLSVSGPAPSTNGECGSANAVAATTAPKTGLCFTGAATSVTGSGPWDWSCVGSSGGKTVSCVAPRQAVSVSGECGSALGACVTGTASNVTNASNESTWTCEGSGGGSTASCLMSTKQATSSGSGGSSGVSGFSCSDFSPSGSCGVQLCANNNWCPVFNQPFAVVGTANGTTPAMAGSAVEIIPSGAVHVGLGLNYQNALNVHAFTAGFTFVPNGWNIVFVVQNSNNNAYGANGPHFAAGAGCEAGFYQAFQPIPPNNVFAMELDQQSPLVNANNDYGAPFTFSSVQIYHADQSPCNPNDYQPNYTYTQKISTSPVSLNEPANAIGTTTGHTYSVTLVYDGSALTMSMYDMTAGGECPGAQCFTHTWENVNIPALVGGDTAYVGLTGGTNQASTAPLLVKSFVYMTQ